MSTKRKFTIGGLATLVLVLMMVIPWTAFASSVVESIVDTTAPTGSVTLAPGGSGSITINLSVTGNQDGTATFEVNRDWTLSGGTFTGSNPQTFTVDPRAGGDPATTFSTTGTVTVNSGQADGTFTLAVGAFDITNSNTTGGKLAAGSSSSYSVTVLTPTPSDTTPPVIGYTLIPSLPDGDNLWYKSEVTLTWTVMENESPLSLVKTDCVDQDITADQAAMTYSCSATSDGGSAGPVSVTIKRDGTNPVITDLGPTSVPDGSNGWYVSAVTNNFEASDATSGFVSDTNPYDFTVSSGTAEGSMVTVSSGSVVDAAGNTNPGIDSAAFKIDLTDPTLVCDAPTPTFTLNQSGAQVSATVHDEGSGPASASASGAADTTLIGSHNATVTGYDNAGRSKSVQCPYNVIYNWNGFFQPVDNLPTVNVAKAGSAIPLKFSLSGNQGLSIFAAGYPTSGAYMCSATAPTDAIEQTLTAGSSSLQYDATTDTYTYVWKTDKSWAGSCRVLVVKLADGTTHTANFNFTK